ncbi:class I SAM-dependent methyltransferase [Jeotgalibaca sp. MA1X17-3]|uniref:class I SAM-dependent methyltransferase n=1 Tax=Jeotgalibaca sp. MA1X17-3 TaxID=2908211 RepID=UPI002883139E|nr:class I SAM-dependent methyltransferase [Jeotgalibaca sp. MA1X17-3]
MLEKAIEYSHQLLKNIVQEPDTVIDATVGKGKDTLFLATLVGETGTVIGFDVQEKAIHHTYKELQEVGLQSRVELHQVGHEQVELFLSTEKPISAAIFNLGYLPGGNKEITTEKETTLKSVSAILPSLKIGGLLLLVVYSGP